MFLNHILVLCDYIQEMHLNHILVFYSAYISVPISCEV
jgi:hypothetical protein